MLVLGRQYDRRKHLLRRQVARLTRVEKSDVLISATEIVDTNNTRDIHVRVEIKINIVTVVATQLLFR